MIDESNLEIKPGIDKGKNKNKSKNKNKLLGQGSYGCVYYPGISCDGKLNKKSYVTKLQEIGFYSANEIAIGKYIKKHIPNYKALYAPIMKHCIVSFQTIQQSDLNISECETLFPKSTDNNNDNYYDNNYYGNDFYGNNSSDSYVKKYDNYDNYNNYENIKINYEKLHTKYYLMYMNYIHNKTLKKYFTNYKTFNLYVVDLLKTFFSLIKSIGMLVNNKIIHNDLHVNNILINLKNNKPVIIDYGLSMFYDKCFKYQKNNIDFEYLKLLIFDFRDDQYHVILEKRFLSFIIYNKSDNYSASISNNYQKNELTQSIIDIFIKDSYESIANQKVIDFNNVELAEYYKSIKQFYYQFLNRSKYPDYNVIIIYLLKFLFKYTDLYSLVFDIYYIHKSVIFDSSIETDNSASNLLFGFFLKLFKKTLHPNPLMRLQHNELSNICDCIITTIKSSENALDYDVFIKEFNDFLTSHSISFKSVFNKKFSYLDFRVIISEKVSAFVKQHF
jgi:serine/threonine protein kinase